MAEQLDEEEGGHRPIASGSVEAEKTEQGRKHLFYRKKLSEKAGGKQLGCSMMELPPGKRSFPLHWHAANEEAIYVLEGKGSILIGEVEHAICAGDYVALPAGPLSAHQMINTSHEVLRYICFSTMIPTDITVYPRSGKVGLFGGAAPGGNGAERFLSGFLSLDAEKNYWDGED